MACTYAGQVSVEDRYNEEYGNRVKELSLHIPGTLCCQE
jgi:hypothetical protein